MNKLHRLFGAFLLCFGLMGALWVGLAHAQSLHTGSNVTISKNQTLNTSFYGASHNVDVAGTVNGDVVCAGQTVDISGVVHGDVVCAGQTVDISGKVDGNVRLVAQSVNLSAQIGKNASVVAQTLNIDGNSKIGADLSGAVNMLTLDGAVGRDIAATATTMQVNGQVGRNMSVTVNRLAFGSGARVLGEMSYVSNREAQVDNGAVLGKVAHSLPGMNRSYRLGRALFGFSIAGFIFTLLTGLFAALAIVLIMPQAVRMVAAEAKKQFSWSILTGFVASIVTPLLVFALLFTVIGVPLALLLLLVWLVLMGLSWIVAAYLLGSLLLSKLKNPIAVMLLGMIVLVILVWIPILGFFVSLIAMWVGIGSILRVLHRHWPKPRYDQA